MAKNLRQWLADGHVAGTLVGTELVELQAALPSTDDAVVGTVDKIAIYTNTKYSDINARVTTIQSNLDVYGSIFVDGGTTTQSIGAGSNYTVISAFSVAATGGTGMYNGCIPNRSLNKIGITSPGLYDISYSLNFGIDTTTEAIKHALFVGGVEQNHIHCRSYLDATADESSDSARGLVYISTATVGSPVDVEIKIKDAVTTAFVITVNYANITITRVRTLDTTAGTLSTTSTIAAGVSGGVLYMTVSGTTFVKTCAEVEANWTIAVGDSGLTFTQCDVANGEAKLTFTGTAASAKTVTIMAEASCVGNGVDTNVYTFTTGA